MQTADAYVLETNFADELAEIELRLARTTGESIRFFDAFRSVPDDLYAYLTLKQFNGFESVRSALPDWASDEIRCDSTGEATLKDSASEALQFWRMVRDRFGRLHTKNLHDCRVLDYGAGWGRVTRFLAKDVPSTSLYAVEPNPIFADIFERCRLPGVLVRSDWESQEPIPVDPVDLIISFSILTHTSAQLAGNIRRRWLELTKPGSVVAFTIRPGALLYDDVNEMAIFTEIERRVARESYARGELVYKPYSNSVHWGVTVMPLRYLQALFGDQFEVHKPLMLFQNWTQLVVVMVRRSGSEAVNETAST